MYCKSFILFHTSRIEAESPSCNYTPESGNSRDSHKPLAESSVGEDDNDGTGRPMEAGELKSSFSLW